MRTVNLDDIEEAERAVERDRIVEYLRGWAQQEFRYIKANQERGNTGADLVGAAIVAGTLQFAASRLAARRHWDEPAETNDRLWR